MLRTVRSGKAPNVVSQEITGLEPGRVYSLTVYVADYSDVGRFQVVPVSIKLGGVERLTEQDEDRATYTDFYEGARRACWNYHLRVFRAKGTEATLTLSDWGLVGAPGGELGHDIIWDHIKLQPHYDGRPAG